MIGAVRDKLTAYGKRYLSGSPKTQSQNYLGIYLSKDSATVICLGLRGRERNILGCFSVSTEEHEGPTLQLLANLISEGCAERKLEFSEAAVALDCAMFMQHTVHSSFTDPKQITSTIRFDTEEALATDISDAAIAFNIISSNQDGSELTVFTSQRKLLSDVLACLQSNNLDPVTIEPDVNCLSRIIYQNVSLRESRHAGTLFSVLSKRRGYFIAPQRLAGDGPHKKPIVRTFLVGPTQNRVELLAREVPVTAVLVDSDEPISSLKVFDSTGSVDCIQLSQKLGFEAESMSLMDSVAGGPDLQSDCADKADFAIAYGAALALLERADSINFRSDFMPYQGKKVRLQKTLKFSSISVAVLIFALGMYVSAQLLQTKSDRAALREKLKPDYTAAMSGRDIPSSIKEAAKKLDDERKNIEREMKGLLSTTGKKAVSAKLMLVFEAFNKCAAQTSLNIDSVTVTTKSISISGDTSSPGRTQKLREALMDTKLGNLQDTLSTTKGGRHSFSITIMPEK